MSSPSEVPVTVIGGYLGSGKTTLVNQLLRHANGLRLAVLVNEFGALPIDADLIESSDENVINIAGGCVCCSYGSDLIAALLDLQQVQPQPDHVLIEASGVALPDAIAQSVTLIIRYTIDGIIVLADSETIRNQGQDRYLADTIKHQLDAADIILLNKVDLPEPASLNETRQWLASEDADGHVIETENAAVPLPMLLGGHLNRIPKEIAYQTKNGIPHTEHNAMVIYIDQPVDPETVAQQLSDPELDLIRTKGFVCGLDGQIYAVQTVGRRRTISVAPHTPTDTGKIVCIRYRYPIDQQAISEVIANCKKIPLP
jgi:G3E family GTPase